MKNFLQTAIVFHFIITAAASQQAVDDSTAIKTYESGEILITAKPLIEQNYITREAEPVTRISKIQIGNLNSTDVPSALRKIPGISISRYNIVGNYGGGGGGAVFIRGHGSGRPGGEIITMIDNIPRYNSIWTHPLMDILSIDLAENIEIRKGADPVHQGSMSFGSINILSKRQKTPGFNVNTVSSIGSYNTSTNKVEFGGKSGIFDVYVSGSSRQSDGHRDNADGKVQSLYTKAGIRPDNSWDISVLFNTTNGYARDPLPIGMQPLPVAQQYKTDNNLLILKAQNSNMLGNTSVKFYIDDGYADWRQWNTSTSTAQQENGISDYRNTGFRLRHALKQTGNLSLSAGIDRDRIEGTFTSILSQSGTQDGISESFTATAPWVSANLTFGNTLKFTPSFGIRYNYNSVFDNTTGYSAGIVLRQPQKFNMYARFARAFNNPGLYTAVFYEDYWSFAGNPDGWKSLKAEKIDHCEAGISLPAWKTVTLDISAFTDKVSNGLRIILPPPPPPVWQNAGEYSIKGLEVSAFAFPGKNVRIYLGGSFLSADPVTTPNAPEFSISGGINWLVWYNTRIFADFQIIDSQYVQGIRNPASDIIEQIGSFSLMNLKLEKGFSLAKTGFILFCAMENVFDRQYEFRPGYPMPGRMLNGGIKLQASSVKGSH